MTDIRKFIIPGFFFASMAVIFMTRLLYNPSVIVMAQSNAAVNPEPAAVVDDSVPASRSR